MKTVGYNCLNGSNTTEIDVAQHTDIFVCCAQ